MPIEHGAVRGAEIGSDVLEMHTREGVIPAEGRPTLVGRTESRNLVISGAVLSHASADAHVQTPEDLSRYFRDEVVREAEVQYEAQQWTTDESVIVLPRLLHDFSLARKVVATRNASQPAIAMASLVAAIYGFLRSKRRGWPEQVRP